MLQCTQVVSSCVRIVPNIRSLFFGQFSITLDAIACAIVATFPVMQSAFGRRAFEHSRVVVAHGVLPKQFVDDHGKHAADNEHDKRYDRK